MSRTRRALLVVAVLSLAPASAAAYDDFVSFGEPVIGAPVMAGEDPNPSGGGQGRYFTGSLSDGYSCAVCHFGGVQDVSDFELEVTPDPFVDGYRAGETYEILVTAPRGLTSWAATLELVDTRGVGAGDLELIPESAQSTADQCAVTTRPDDLIATHIVTLADPAREVAGNDVCGAEQLRVTWQAPDTATGGVWLNVAAVAADGTGDLAGDFTVTFARTIAPFGAAPEAGRVTNACATSSGRGSGLPALALLAGALLLAARRRHR